MKFSKNISVEFEGFSKQLLKVSYASDGGYMITDLIRIRDQRPECGVFKFATHQENHGLRTAKSLYTAFTSGDVKLSHHPSGLAQISGKNVLSGLDESGKPKGAAIESFTFDKSNDGGMAFGFMTWGLQHHPRDAKEGDLLLKPNLSRVHSAVRGGLLNAVVIEGYYILKKHLPKPPFSQEVVNYHNPIAGDCQLHIVHSPDSSPGVLAFGATLTSTEMKAVNGFTLSGAPGKRYGDYSDGLAIIYPHEHTLSTDNDLNWPPSNI